MGRKPKEETVEKESQMMDTSENLEKEDQMMKEDPLKNISKEKLMNQLAVMEMKENWQIILIEEIQKQNDILKNIGRTLVNIGKFMESVRFTDGSN